MRVKFSIRGKFITLIIIIVAAANIIVGAISINTADKVIKQSTELTLTNVADNVASQVRDINEIEFKMLESLAQIPQIKGNEYTLEQKAAMLTEIQKSNPEKYENIGFCDKNGMSIIQGGEMRDFSGASYFKGAKEKGRFVTNPSLNDVTNTILMFYAVPVYNGNEFVGVISSVIKGNALEAVTNSIDIGYGMHPGLMDMKTGDTIGKPKEQNQGQGDNVSALDPNSDFFQVINKAISGETGISVFTDPFTGTHMIASYRPIDGVDWTVFCAAPYDYYRGGLDSLRKNVVISLIIAVILSIALASLLIGMIIHPLLNVRNSMTDIASGNADLTKRITQTSYDEVGQLVDGFNNFTGKMQAIMKDIKSTNGNLSEVGEDLDASTEDTENSIKQIIDNITDVHNQIDVQSSSVQQTAGAVNEIASNIESLEHMIEKQTAGVSEASSAVEEMIGNINSVNQSVDKMATSFEELISSAREGSSVQTDVNQKIEEIRNQSETLQEANIAIASIAEQTNLLAMNAAIEAAHAGEAGKGFSVVADEIRKLSETSSEQSKTIGDQLTAIQASIQDVVEACGKSSQAFESMSDRIGSTDELVRQIKSAMEEQTEGSKQINDTLHVMNDSTVEVRTASREMSEGNKAILEEVRNLQDATLVMKNSMDVMSDSARKISETGTALSEISSKMRLSIADIGGQIDQFKV